MASKITYTSNINSVRFSTLSSEDILKTSFTAIKSYDLFRNGLPHKEGVYDGHLGTTDHNYRCLTCHNGKKECIGHDGHLALNYPVQAPMCIVDLRKWLKLICLDCGSPIIEEKLYSRFPKNKRLDEASKIARTGIRKCLNKECEKVHPNISKSKNKDEPLVTYAEYLDAGKILKRVKLYPHVIGDILSRISDETVIKLGKHPESHPRNFVTNVIKIPPTSIRPDVKKIGGGRSTNDDLTTLIQYMVKKNDSIPAVLPDEIDPKLDKLIYELNSAYYDFIKGGNAKKGISSGGNPLTSIALRLRGKQGRFRKNQMGKRVRMCCRSTITGDPTIKIDELAIPLKFAKNLQVEEIVQESNKERLMIYFNNGRKKYPGCSKIIKKSTGKEHGIEKAREKFELEIGDIIYRDLINGDPVLFNRQPSLAPSAFTCHKALITENTSILTFRMNVIACSFYNADFD